MHHSPKILVVDDDPDVLFTTARILHQKHFEVLQATCGQEALDIARSSLPDLILLDAVLPDISGIEVLRILKSASETSGIYIAIVSGLKIDTDDQSNGLESGADDYIVRPVNNRVLLARVNALLRLKDAETQLSQHRDQLEQMVRERTADLEKEIQERKRIEVEREKLQAHLNQAQKMESVGRLAGGIAHDFNNIISIISGNISYALSHCEQNPELNEVLNDVLKGTQRAQKLTQQLLTFAKGGAPIKELNNINTIIRETANFIIRGSKSRCNFNLAEDLWLADVDSGQISQVVGNLLLNADQSMPDGGVIDLKSENIDLSAGNDQHLPPGRYTRIEIIDQGIGIQSEHLHKVFEPFFTTKQIGSGLGLATAYSIVEKHNGRIDLSSEPGTGTVCTVYLPASLEKTAATPQQEKVDHAGQGTILVMDDETSLLKMTSRILMKMGYSVETATDGQKAVTAFRAAQDQGRKFELIILDLTVPGGAGGMETISQLLEIDPDAKVVVSSGYSNAPIMADYKKHGFCDILPKPYTREDISALLARVLA